MLDCTVASQLGIFSTNQKKRNGLQQCLMIYAFERKKIEFLGGTNI